MIFPKTGARFSGSCALDQEIVLLELGALHFLAHPDRRHAAAGPKHLRILARTVFRRRLLARTLSFRAGTAAARRAAALLRRANAGQFRQLFLEISALLAYLFAQRALKLFDVLAELPDIHFIGGFGAGGPAASLGFLGHVLAFCCLQMARFIEPWTGQQGRRATTILSRTKKQQVFGRRVVRTVISR